MFFRRLQDSTPLTQLLFAFGLMLLGLFLSSFVASMLLIPLFGINIFVDPEALKQYSDPNVMHGLRFFQLIAAIGTFGLPPVFYAVNMAGFNWKNFLNLSWDTKAVNFLLIGLAMVVALPLINWLAEFNDQLELPGFLKGIEIWMRDKEISAGNLTEALLTINTPVEYAYTLLIVALIPAVSEELLFRGVIQRISAKMTGNIHLGIWISAALFSAIHIQFFGFIPRMLMGALLGYSLYWSGSLWVPIAGHFINNAGAVTLSYLIQSGRISEDAETIGTNEQELTFLLISAILITLILVGMNRLNKGRFLLLS